MEPLPEAVAGGWTEAWLDRPWGRLRYVTAGSGPPLLLCHGFIGSAENFESWVPALAGEHRLIIPDLPGFGASGRWSGSYTSRALAMETLELANSLSLETYDLGGLCLGAQVALELVAIAPHRARRLILHTPFLDPRVLPASFRAQVALFTLPGVFNLIAALGHNRMVADLYRRLVVEGSDPVDRRAADVNFENQLRAVPKAARQWLREGLRLHLTDLLQRWPHDSLVIAAADDRLLDLERLSRLCSMSSRVRLELIDAAGHGWTPQFQLRQVEVLQEFLSQQSGGYG